MRRRLATTTAVVLAATVSAALSSCVPGAQNLGMAAPPDCLSDGPAEIAATPVAGEPKVHRVLRENELCGQDATSAREILEDEGIPVSFMSRDGATQLDEPSPGARVIDVTIVGLESYPVIYTVDLTLDEEP